MVDINTLKVEIVEHLKPLQPEKVLLFGSFAYGKPNEESDIDLFIIKIDKNRDSFARELKNRGIYTGLHFIPLHLLSYYKNKYSLRVNDFPVALTNYQQILSLPIYPSLKESDVMYICKQIKEIAKTRV